MREEKKQLNLSLDVLEERYKQNQADEHIGRGFNKALEILSGHKSKEYRAAEIVELIIEVSYKLAAQATEEEQTVEQQSLSRGRHIRALRKLKDSYKLP